MNSIRNVAIALLAVSLFFWLIESLFAANPAQKAFFRRRGFKTDLCYLVLNPLLTKSISQVGIVLILALIFRENIASIRDMFTARDTFLARQPFWLQGLEILVVGDFVGYWTHRWFHRRSLWRFHAIHHCSRDLDWLSSVRFHPVNDWIQRWVQITTVMIMGFVPTAILAYAPFLTFYAVFVHANVSWGLGPLGWLMVSPKFHRWHHTSQDEGLDKNFAGFLPVFDKLFGTYYMPKDRLPTTFGLKDEEIPEGFFGQLVYPFRRTPPDKRLTPAST